MNLPPTPTRLRSKRFIGRPLDNFGGGPLARPDLIATRIGMHALVHSKNKEYLPKSSKKKKVGRTSPETLSVSPRPLATQEEKDGELVNSQLERDSRKKRVPHSIQRIFQKIQKETQSEKNEPNQKRLLEHGSSYEEKFPRRTNADRPSWERTPPSHEHPPCHLCQPPRPLVPMERPRDRRKNRLRASLLRRCPPARPSRERDQPFRKVQKLPSLKGRRRDFQGGSRSGNS